MEFGLWEKYYKEILDDFGFSREDDEESAKLLDEILSTEGCLTLNDLAEIVDFSDKFIVFGAGPSVKEHVEMLKNDYELKDYVLVAADGATTALSLSPAIRGISTALIISVTSGRWYPCCSTTPIGIITVFVFVRAS